MNDWMDAEGHVERAHKFFEDGQWAEAEGELREAIALNPYRAEWHFNLGLTLEAAGRFEDAVRAFRDCHTLQQDDAQVPLLIGINLLRSDKPRESLEWLERAEKLDPTDAASFVHRIDAYIQLGDHEQAEVMFYLAQQNNPKNADAYALLADSLIARGLHEKAVWCLREAANLDPNLPGIHARLGEAYAATGRLERARQLYLRELRNNPGDVETLLDLGCLLVEMNRLPEAGEKFRRVLEMESDHPDAHFYLADLAERQAQPEAALEQFRVVLRLDPGYGVARCRAARLLIKSGTQQNLSEAKELLDLELEDFSHRAQTFRPADLSDLGRALLEIGRPAEAKRVFQRLIDVGPEDPDAWHMYSVALLELGDREKGIDACRRVLRFDPRSAAAMHNLSVAHVFEGQWTKARYWVNQALLVDPDDAALRHLRLKLRLHTVMEGIAWVLSPLRGLFFRRRRGA